MSDLLNMPVITPAVLSPMVLTSVISPIVILPIQTIHSYNVNVTYLSSGTQSSVKITPIGDTKRKQRNNDNTSTGEDTDSEKRTIYRKREGRRNEKICPGRKIVDINGISHHPSGKFNRKKKYNRKKKCYACNVCTQVFLLKKQYESHKCKVHFENEHLFTSDEMSDSDPGFKLSNREISINNKSPVNKNLFISQMCLHSTNNELHSTEDADLKPRINDIFVSKKSAKVPVSKNVSYSPVSHHSRKNVLQSNSKIDVNPNIAEIIVNTQSAKTLVNKNSSNSQKCLRKRKNPLHLENDIVIKPDTEKDDMSNKFPKASVKSLSNSQVFSGGKDNVLHSATDIDVKPNIDAVNANIKSAEALVTKNSPKFQMCLRRKRNASHSDADFDFKPDIKRINVSSKSPKALVTKKFSKARISCISKKNVIHFEDDIDVKPTIEEINVPIKSPKVHAVKITPNYQISHSSRKNVIQFNDVMDVRSKIDEIIASTKCAKASPSKFHYNSQEFLSKNDFASNKDIDMIEESFAKKKHLPSNNFAIAGPSKNVLGSQGSLLSDKKNISNLDDDIVREVYVNHNSTKACVANNLSSLSKCLQSKDSKIQIDHDSDIKPNIEEISGNKNVSNSEMSFPGEKNILHSEEDGDIDIKPCIKINSMNHESAISSDDDIEIIDEKSGNRKSAGTFIGDKVSNSQKYVHFENVNHFDIDPNLEGVYGRIESAKSLVGKKLCNSQEYLKDMLNDYTETKVNSNDVNSSEIKKKGSNRKIVKRRVKDLLNPKVAVPKKYTCNFCKQSFTTKRHLGVHLRNHSLTEMLKENDVLKCYVCDLCQQSFITKRTLFDHLKAHTVKKSSYVQCQNRNRKERTNRKIQSSSHTSALPSYTVRLGRKEKYVFSFPKTFSQQSVPEVPQPSQKRKLLSEKNPNKKKLKKPTCKNEPVSTKSILYCYKCNKKFSTKNSLRVHLDSHSGRK